MSAVSLPSPDLILAAAVTAAVAGIWLLLPFSRDRRSAQWLGGLIGAAALAGFAFQDHLRGLRRLEEAGTVLVVMSPVDLAIRFALTWFVMAAAAAAFLWLLLPRDLKRRTGRCLLGLLGGAAMARLGLAGTPSLPAPGVILAAAVAAAAASLWHLLPRGVDRRADRWVGLVLGGLGPDAIFLVVSLVAVISGAATVVSRSPVYAAIWFALALAGVAGVLLVLGAQFLGVATIVVYAGAILVMFLFVLMLAQPAGMAPYDRVSNEPLLSAVAGGVLLGLLTLFVGRLSAETPACCRLPSRTAAVAASPTHDSASAPTEADTAGDPLQENHVARLGGELFGRHLLAVEAAGVLLLVALIGSIAIVSRHGDPSGELSAAGRAR